MALTGDLHGLLDASSILLFFLVTITVKIFLGDKKGRNLPGPTPLPFVGNALLLAGSSSNIIPKICNLLDVYNGLLGFWIGPKLVVFVSKPEYLEVVCTHPKLQHKSDHYDYIKPLLGESLLTGNGEPLKSARKLLMPAMRPNLVKNLVERFEDNAETLVRVLDKEAGGPEFNSFPYLRNCTYDIIYEFVYGGKIHAQTEYLHVLDVTEEIMDLIYQRALKLWLQWDPLYYLLPAGRKLQMGVEYCNKFNTIHIRETLRKRGKTTKNGDVPLVQYLYQHLGEDHFESIREHVETIIVTGFDTTAGTMGFILMMLGMYPNIQQKAYEEIICMIKHPREERYNQMEYLDRIIKETLRLFPVGAILFREAIEDVVIGGFLIPKGTVVSPVMIQTHRNAKIFPNPLNFNPDNFLPDRANARHPYSYIPFSAGSRTCYGTKYGMLSMKVIISRFLLNYKVFCDMKMEDIQLKPEITLKTQHGFNVRVERR